MTHSSVVPQTASLPDDDRSIDDSLDELRRRVAASPLAVALYDVSARRLLAVSDAARRARKLGDVDLDRFDIVEDSPNVELMRALAMLLAEREIDRLQWRLPLVATDGTTRPGAARAERVGGAGPPVRYLVHYEIDEHVDDGDAEAGTFDMYAAADDRDTRRLVDEVTRLRQHLTRIAHEIEASGLAGLALPPDPSSVPALRDLSPRQREVLSRLLRGERVPTIAKAMFLSPSTVRNHLAVIFRKVGVASQVELLELMRDGTSTNR